MGTHLSNCRTKATLSNNLWRPCSNSRWYVDWTRWRRSWKRSKYFMGIGVLQSAFNFCFNQMVEKYYQHFFFSSILQIQSNYQLNNQIQVENYIYQSDVLICRIINQQMHSFLVQQITRMICLKSLNLIAK